MNCKELAELSPLYLAGELDEVRMAGFDIHLRTCPACATDIEQQKDLDALLCDGVLAEQIDTSSVDMLVRQTIQAQRESKFDPQSSTSAHRYWIAIAAAIVLAAIAGLSYRYWPSPVVAPVYAAVVHDHQVEVVEGAHRPWVSDSAVIDLLAAKQGVSESALAAIAPANYHLERAKLCPLDGSTYLHLVYTDGAHELSVFLHQGDTRSFVRRNARLCEWPCAAHRKRRPRLSRRLPVRSADGAGGHRPVGSCRAGRCPHRRKRSLVSAK